VMNDARSKWPLVALDQGVFASFLRERVELGNEIASLDRLQRLDIFLACACSRGLVPAIAVLEAVYLPQVVSSLRTLEFDRTDIDLGVSSLFDELLDRKHESVPGITRYRGRSSLLAWLQVAATRKALCALEEKNGGADPKSAEKAWLKSLIADPELARLRVLHRDSFNAAFLSAARDLSSRDRNLLRYAYAEGLTRDEIARLYGVDRESVIQWQEKAFKALIEGTRRRLKTRSAIDAAATGPRDGRTGWARHPQSAPDRRELNAPTH